ncbi:unnamed protein product, partial [Iphiclides podalirius]
MAVDQAPRIRCDGVGSAGKPGFITRVASIRIDLKEFRISAARQPSGTSVDLCSPAARIELGACDLPTHRRLHSERQIKRDTPPPLSVMSEATRATVTNDNERVCSERADWPVVPPPAARVTPL